MNVSTVDIIIPVYKTEEYIEECVESVLLQDYPYIEIILVDDGSPDRCPEICDSYERKYSNVKVIHQKNQGPGLSKNAGMEASDGTYLFFLDSDDKLDGKHAVSHLVREAEKERADITVGNFRRFHTNFLSEPNRHRLRSGAYTKSPAFRFNGFYRYGHLAYNWGKLYRRAFLKKYDLKCREYSFAEDKVLNMMCLAYEPVYAFTEESVYQYRVNESSVTFRYKENLMSVWISIAKDFFGFLKERKIKRHYGDLIAFHIFFGSFFLAKQELQHKNGGVFSAARVMRQYGREPIVKEAMKALAKGKFLRCIDSVSLEFSIRSAAALFSAHGYLFYALGIALLRSMKIDEKISRSRYKRKVQKKL